MAESIPEDVVVDILLRLPAKSLVRFKWVCKQWRSLISDRAFAKWHLQRLKAGDLIPSQRIIIGGGIGPLKTVDYEALDGGGEGRVVVPHGIKPLQESRIVGSCDGLLCLIGPSNFVIYNPTTREYIGLPGSDFVDQATLFSGARNNSFYGFGYDSF
ncbi:F-box protein CPR1-like [Eucalyptus grandis]|uniref:F-box protein CPR1-like n=1 Tax=Eucalyptus grandis TaxID=71139 RepID=UPI00192EBF8D|nr:F-box protein CPR1-like [Eucalyptus grandis]